jgi:NAD(P)-dependent dehydrogenase (short-subunit alcohol dehydrogenase family)
VTPRLAAWHVALVFTVAVSAFARVPLQTAIDYVADFRNAPQWQHGLAAVDIEAPFPQATHVVEVRRFLGRRIEAPGDLVDWVPGRGFTVRGHSGPLRVESRYSFAREADGTRISLSLTMAARGLARIGEPVLRRSLTRELSLAFERLSPTLDGHVQDASPGAGLTQPVIRPPGAAGPIDPARTLLKLGTAAAGVAVARVAIRAAREQIGLNGKTALVTGASRGLGLLIARELAAGGCQVAICARTKADLQRAEGDLRSRGATVAALPCDVSDEKQAREFVRMAAERLGPPDILVNNAGVIRVGPLGAMTAADFDEALGVMFWGTVYTSLAALEHMRPRRAGNIVNIASIGGKISVPHLLPYGCAKSAVAGFSQGLCCAVADDGISVTTVLPGMLRTGSHLRAGYRGDPAREFAWFALGSSLPLASMDAERAARRIVAAMRRGRAQVVLPAPAAAGIWLNSLFPEAMATMMRRVNRMLPSDEDRGSAEGIAARGQVESRLRQWAAKLGDDAARRLNQIRED